MSRSKFKVEDHVKNLLIGVKTSGIIVGIVTGDFYLLRKRQDDMPHWSELYKGWNHKCVYFVQLDKPAAHCTVKEFVKHKPDNVTEMEAVNQFHKVPLTNYMAYPEDDLKRG